MKFNSKTVAFGRHETFALRYGWLTKGFDAVSEDPKVFTSDDATVTLGVGKNMVSSIRYWCQAVGIIQSDGDRGFEATELGEAIFGEEEGYDPYLEDEGTIWLVHWLLVSNPELATSWYWFFNHFHKREFTSDECSTALKDFVKKHIYSKVAVGTLQQDAKLIMRMYAKSKGNGRTPLEEALDSPLSILGLISQSPGGRSYRSYPDERKNLPLGIFGYAVVECMKGLDVEQMPVEDLMYLKSGAAVPGAAFRMTENALIFRLERLAQELPELFELRETAGIHQFYIIGDVEAIDLLEFHYAPHAEGRMAA